MTRKKVFSVSIQDCEVQTFRAGGKGGQAQNKRNTGVRVIHHPSGARGESREHRGQLENRRTAFRRMSETPEFQSWCRFKALQLRPIEDIVDEQMAPENIKTEIKQDGKWTEN